MESKTLCCLSQSSPQMVLCQQYSLPPGLGTQKPAVKNTETAVAWLYYCICSPSSILKLPLDFYLRSLFCALSLETQWDGFLFLKIQVSDAVSTVDRSLIKMSRRSDILKYSEGTARGQKWPLSAFVLQYLQSLVIGESALIYFLWFKGLHWWKSNIVSLSLNSESRSGLYKSEVI